MKHYWIAMLLLLVTSACTAVRQIPPEPTVYLLTAVGTPAPVSAPRDAVLRVAIPRAEPGFEGDGMVYTETPATLYVYRESRWADVPAQMLTPLLVETLERSGAFRAIVTQPGSGRADYQLEVQLLRLQQEFYTTPSQVRLGLRASLIDASNRQVVASRAFHTLQPAPSDNAYGGVQAANAAVAELLTELTEFVVQTLNSALNS